tara:strand:+ start:4812 stop:5495 length:684 start_codon:yes stop_codon:yes gene_type:complete
MSVNKKLMQARIELQGTELKKSGHNKFAGYYYFELGDFLPSIQSIFNKIGLCGVISYSTEYATLTITDTEDGTVIVITSPMAEANLKGAHPIQNLGAVETYSRRYLWMTAMEIVEHDILDSGQSSEDKVKPKPEAKPKPIPEVMEGKEGDWQLKVTRKPEGDPNDWVEIVLEAVDMQLGQAGSEGDVMSIFKKNREIFDQLKLQSEVQYTALMNVFKKTKAKFKEQA